MNRRGSGFVFQKNWNEYKSGFGSIEDKAYWIGLEKIHQITSFDEYGLEVVLTRNDGTVKIMNWDEFRIGGEDVKYKLTIGGYKPGSSGLTDKFGYHNGMKFSTMDNDNDKWNGSCSNTWGKSGGWFNACNYVNLNYPTYIYYPGGGSNQYDESTMIIKR